MSEFLWIKLSEGKRVRDPLTQQILIPGKAYRVRDGQFWMRRLESRDVELCSPPKSAQPEVETKSEIKVSAKKKEKAGE